MPASAAKVAPASLEFVEQFGDPETQFSGACTAACAQAAAPAERGAVFSAPDVLPDCKP